MLQKIISYFCIVSILIVFGCAYYNTFFNAKEYYKTGMEKQKNSKSDDLSGDVKSNYNDAIKKCWKLIDTYGDSSKYADDALLLIGKSYYNLRDYEKSEQVLQQFLLKYLNSEYIPEAKLWLAKNYIELDKEKEAQDLLDKLFDDKVSNEIAAQSFYILGNLYYKNENYETAIDNFQKCVEITDNDEIKGDAEYKTGEAFFYLGEYENAIYHFKKIEKLDVPVIKEYEAIIQKINALVKLNRFDEADQILRVMMGNQRFSDQFSLIQTKLANISEIQGDIDYAMELYYDILDKYPKKEGAALSSFYLGQLYEYEIGNFDSAKAYYDRVPKEYSKSEAKEDAKKRSDLLKDYLTIRDQILKDKSDLYKLEHGDSTLVDSVEVEPDLQDTVDVEQEPFEPVDNEITFPSFAAENELQRTEADTLLIDEKKDSLALIEQQKKKTTPKKKAVARNPEEVEGSLVKNSFAIAEYFLLKYQNYDSSAWRYKNFVNNFSDSILTPKAYYSLYFIYNSIFEDSVKADSIKKIILSDYSNTAYGKKLSPKNMEKKQDNEQNTDMMKQTFLKAEDYMTNAEYDSAISLYNQVSEADSGSIWAQKSRYAVAYIYENFISDTVDAIKSYKILSNEYPNTEYGKIAKNKIADPAAYLPDSTEEIQEEKDISDQNIIAGEKLEEEVRDYIPIDPSMIVDTEMLDSKRPVKLFNKNYNVEEKKEETAKPDRNERDEILKLEREKNADILPEKDKRERPVFQPDSLIKR